MESRCVDAAAEIDANGLLDRESVAEGLPTMGLPAEVVSRWCRAHPWGNRRRRSARLGPQRVCWAAVLVPVPVLAAVWMPMEVAMWWLRRRWRALFEEAAERWNGSSGAGGRGQPVSTPAMAVLSASVTGRRDLALTAVPRAGSSY